MQRSWGRWNRGTFTEQTEASRAGAQGAEARGCNLKLGRTQSLCNPEVLPDPTPLSVCLSATPMLLQQLGDKGKPSPASQTQAPGSM